MRNMDIYFVIRIPDDNENSELVSDHDLFNNLVRATVMLVHLPWTKSLHSADVSGVFAGLDNFVF